MNTRPERHGDEADIRTVNEAAFPTPLEAQLVDRLREAGRLTISFVAEVEGRIVGHVAFSPVTVAGGSQGLGLAPVAVLPEFQRRGIAAELIREGLRRSRECGAPFVVVLGEPAYYGRFGFAAASRFGLADEYGGGDAFQVIGLREGGIPTDGGLVRYAAEFQMFSDAPSE